MLDRTSIAAVALGAGALLVGCGASSSQNGSATGPGAAGQVQGAQSDINPEPPQLEVVAELTEGPGNITVDPSGQVFMSLHQFYEPSMRVVRLGANGALTEVAAGAVDTVLGIQADRDGLIWMLDNGMRGGGPPRLVAWEPAAKRQFAVVDLAAATPDNAFVNDLVVDKDHDAIYIADPAGGSNAAIIVVDPAAGTARRVLEGHPSMVPEDTDLIIDDTPVRVRTPDGQEIRPRIGINPIAADARNEWLYYGPMHGRSLYRVRTDDLRNPDLTPEALASRVERWADKPICDGIAVDNAGNVYISDLGANAVGVIDTERRYRVLLADPRLSWPDAFSFGPDGYLYTVANQLHRTAALNAGTQTAAPPFYVFRFKPLAPGMPGR